MPKLDWIKLEEDQPEEGALVEVYYPLCVFFNGNTTGPVAIAVKRGDLFFYADEPSLLRFEPTHWRPYSIGHTATPLKNIIIQYDHNPYYTCELCGFDITRVFNVCGKCGARITWIAKETK